MQKENIFLVLSLVFVFVLVYSPHFGYRFPYHVDEWNHIEESLKLKEKGLDHFKNARTIFFEIGFTSFVLLAGIFGNIVSIYPYLPALFAVLSSIILFYFLEKKFNFYVGISAIFFFASLPSNVNFLGVWFFVPVVMAIPFLYLSLFIFENSLEEDKPKILIFLVILLSILFLIHPPSALFFLPPALITALSNIRFIKKNCKYLPVLFIFLIPLIFFFSLFWEGSFFETLGFFNNYLSYTPEFEVLSISYNPVITYGILPFIFALIGVYFSFKIKKARIFSYLSLFALLDIIVYKLVDISYLAHHQRVLYYLMIGLVPLSALGFVYSFNAIRAALAKKGRIAKYSLLSFFLISAFFLTFYDYYELNPQAKLYRLVDADDYRDLQELRDINDSRVMVPAPIGNVLYTLTGKEPVAGIYWKGGNKEKVDEFYETGNCTFQEEFMKKYSLNYVYSHDQINCTFLKTVYSSNNSIYSLKSDG